MIKIIKDNNKVEELLDRGVEKIYPGKEELRDKLLKGERIKLYCGYDPSAPALHIGNAISLKKLGDFQELGHEIVFLIGDFTGMIGDPTDKSAARKKLTRKEVLQNAKNYTKQASAYLKFDGENPAKIEYNSKWLDKLNFVDIIELSSNFTVQQMIQRDMFQKRLKEERPIYLHEFLYPLVQGYDSVAMDIDLEIGGNDQMFNMMAGRDLMKSMGKKNKFVMTLKLLADDKGKKMGKSEGNAVFLDTDPNNMYGIIMSWPDEILINSFELCTRVPMGEIKEMKRGLKNSTANPRDLKMKLAYEITSINYGNKLANGAQENFVKTVQKKEIPDEMESKKLKAGKINIMELLVEVGLAASKSEARRLITQNGVKVDGKIINDFNFDINLSSKEILLQKGKRNFIKVSA